MSSLYSFHRHLFRDFQFEGLISFHWSCFIVPSRLEICSFIAILVCLSLFHSVYAQKKKKKKKKKEKKREKRKKIYIYINKCACVCIQYKYSLSTYVDL